MANTVINIPTTGTTTVVGAVDVNLRDGASNLITSTISGPSRGIDVNLLGGDVTIDNAELAMEVDAADGDNIAIKDSSGTNALDINAAGAAKVDASAYPQPTFLSGYTRDPNNEQTALLIANETFTGAWTDVANVPGFINIFFGDVAFAEAYIEWSADGINLDTSVGFGSSPITILSGTGVYVVGRPTTIKNQPFYRVRIVNGPTPQSFFGSFAALLDAPFQGEFRLLGETLAFSNGGLITNAIARFFDGTGYSVVSSTNPFPVDAASLPLPTGAATAANQLANGHDVTVDNAAGANAVNIQDGGNSITVDGPLTDSELRASAVPVSEQASSSGASTNVAAAAADTALLTANASRLGATVYNDSTANLFVKLGTGASLTSFTVRLISQGYYEVPFKYSGDINGIWDVAVGSARITEIT